MKKFVLAAMVFMLWSSTIAQYIPKFDLQGHRGARGLKPENSITGFITALQYGVTTLELDVVITKDKQVLVSHEPFISPEICFDSTGSIFTNPTKYNIYQLTYDQLQKFDCGSKVNSQFPQQQKEITHKPLLKDVIIAIENHIKSYTHYEVDYNIEIKSEQVGDGKLHPVPKEFSDLVFTLINEYLPWERVVVQSFDFRVLQYWHINYPKVRLAALVENKKTIDENLAALSFSPSIYSPYYKLLNQQSVTDLKQKRIRVIPWTVNELEDMKRLKTWGVDGIITDYPNRAAELDLGLKLNGMISPNVKGN
jgi:glycerophosphoryl diester phosphodiesterase